MGKILTPTGQKEIINQRTDYNLNDVVADIAIGEYALVIGKEAILDNTKEEFKCNDSENVLLDTVFEVLSEPRNASIRNLSDASDQYTADKIKSAILQIMDKDNQKWNFDSNDVDPALCKLLKSGIFKTIIVTTFDPYVENVLYEKWGSELRVNSLWDISNIHKSSLGIPTLYYAFGKADAEIYCACVALSKLRSIGYKFGDIDDKRVKDEFNRQFAELSEKENNALIDKVINDMCEKLYSKDDLECLYKCEHYRWNVERLLNGVRVATEDEQKLHIESLKELAISKDDDSKKDIKKRVKQEREKNGYHPLICSVERLNEIDKGSVIYDKDLTICSIKCFTDIVEDVAKNNLSCKT